MRLGEVVQNVRRKTTIRGTKEAAGTDVKRRSPSTVANLFGRGAFLRRRAHRGTRMNVCLLPRNMVAPLFWAVD